MKQVLCCWMVLSGCALAAAAVTGVPAAVSPGDGERVTPIGDVCPTFSWGAVAGATGYELVVYEVVDDGAAAAPALRQEIPGSALSWTPALDRCLGRGGRFAWSVRAVDEAGVGGWSEERLFRVAGEAGLPEAAQALAVLGRFLGEGGTLAELNGSPAWAQAVAAAPNAGAVREEPGAGDRDGAPARGEEAGAERSAGEPLSPSRAIQEIEHLGLEATIEESHPSASVAVKGMFDATNSGDQVAGFLGVAMPDTEFEDFLTPYLSWLDEDEIGVLGFSLNDSTDNWGVVGVGGDRAWGGRFLNSDGAGDAVHQVMLAGPDVAIQAHGDVLIRDGSLACPFGTYAVGSWCILGQKQPLRIFATALRSCWELGMRLCPLDAIMACDHLEPSGAACTLATDDDEGGSLWLGDMPPAYEQVDETASIDEVSADPTDPWSQSKAWKYRPAGPPGADLLEEDWKATLLASFCCTTPR